MYGILCDASCLVEWGSGGIILHRLSFHAFQVVDERVEHHVELGGRQVELLVVICKGLSGVRHVTERTYQVEVAQRTKCHHLCDVCLQFALRVTGIAGSHLRCILDDGVTAVNNVVEAIPRCITVGGHDILIEHVQQVGIIGAVQSGTDILAAGLTPDNHTAHKAVGLHARVTTCNDAVHVGLFIPEVLQHYLTQRFYL